MEKQQPKIETEETLTPEELTEKYSQEVADFFEVEKYPDIKVVVYNSMSDLATDFEKYTNQIAPVWLKGFSPYGQRWEEIWLISPDATNEFGRPIGIDEFQKSLKHEIVHTYQKIYSQQNNLNHKLIPPWLKEGIALYVANQNSQEPLEFSTQLLKNADWLGTTQYGLGEKIVTEIMKNFGKEKLFELFRMNNEEELYKELQRMFDWLK